MKKRILSILLAAIMVASLLPVGVFSASAEDTLYMTDAGTGARSATDADGNVYLGGNYIEIGISKHGSFGTIPSTTSVPKNFHTYWFLENTENAEYDNGDSLGMIADGDGWNKGNDPIAGDFFVPGTPYEGWCFCYMIDLDGDGTCETTRTLQVADLDGQYTAVQWSVEPVTSIVNTGDSSIVAARTVGTTLDGVEITLDYSFGVDDLYYTTEVNIKNNSGKKISDAFYGRDFDPDQDEWFNGNYATYNKTICNPDPSKEGGTSNLAMVVARGNESGAGFFFLSLDNRATAIDDVWGLIYYYDDRYASIIAENQTEYTKYDADRDSNDVTKLEELGFKYNDTGIGILCDFGTVENGASDKFVYFSSLDPDVTRCVKNLICEHADANKDHICDLCNKTISDHEDTNNDHKCDICGGQISECVDADNDHKCDICGGQVSDCKDENNDHKCDICGGQVSQCKDENNDHKCDICGGQISECEDADNDHKCDICGGQVSECEDADNDHKCDICGGQVSECVDADKDHKCDICGGQVSEHKGVLVEGTAAMLESAGFKSYYKCDCGKFFEDATCKVEITDLDAWKAQGGNGYIAKLEEEPKSPQTGDTSNMTLWVMLMALSSMGLCACLVLGKKRKNVQ